jgi:ABC-type bacteriocin/lantibiotic exporter with double-glycine peptidase domain
VLAYHDVHLPIETLREECGTSRDGVKATVLMDVARRHQFSAEAFRVELEDLKKIKVPVIAFWNFTHYVVIKKIGKRHVYINDPACGQVTVDFDEFDKLFTGVILLILPTEKTDTLLKTHDYLGGLKQWFSGMTMEYLFLFVCLLVAIIGSLITAQISSIFINFCLLKHKINWIPWISLCSILTGMILLGSTWLHKWNQYKACTMAVLQKSSAVISHALKLPMIFYALRQKSEIIALLIRIELVTDLLFKNGTQLLVNLLTAIICFGCMLKIDYVLASISIFITILSIIFFYLITKINLSYEKINAISSGKLSTYAMSAIRNFETIKACGMEEKTMQKWYSLFCQKMSIRDKLSTFTISINSFHRIMGSLAMLLILYWGSIRVARGLLLVGHLVAYYAIHLFFYKSIIQFLQSIKECQSAYISYLRINDINHYPEDKRFINPPLVPHPMDNHDLISCNNVYFYYNVHAQPILSAITLHIQQGQHIAFVGETGSGKSTLSKLLCGLFFPREGNIYIAGNNMSDLSTKEITSYCAYVSQDVTLFSGTIYDNLTLWKIGLPVEKIQKAIQIACLDELISKRGMHGKVEENGYNLSGGEKQRIDLARALIQDTPIIILDEATSALDIQTENQIISHLRQLNKTIIYVAHRLSTIQHCDNIFILERGKIIEQGSHHFLLNRKNHYFNLIQKES